MKEDLIKVTPTSQDIPWGKNPKGKNFLGLKIKLNIDKLWNKCRFCKIKK